MKKNELKNLRKDIFSQQDVSSIFDLAWNGMINEVKNLLEKGEDVNSRNGKKRHTSLLHIAAEKNNFKLFEILLLFKPNLDVQDRLLMTPLFYALKHNNYEFAEALLQNGAEVNVRDRYDCLLVYRILESKGLKEVKLLVKHGAILYEKEHSDKRSLLRRACHMMKHDIVEFLLNFDIFKTTLNEACKEGYTALHHTCWGPKLLKTKKSYRGTALTDCPDSLKLLLDAGADPTLVDYQGRIPLNLSMNSEGVKTGRIWLERGFTFESNGTIDNRFLACKFGHLETLKFLKDEAKIDLVCENEEGMSLLEYSFMRGRFNCFYYILDIYTRRGSSRTIQT